MSRLIRSETESKQGPLECIVKKYVHDEVHKLLAHLVGGIPIFTSTDRPAKVSRRTYNTRCRTVVDGAKQDQPRNGWSCTRAAWFAAATKKRAPKLRVIASSDEDLADQFLSEAGFRKTATK